MGGEGGGGGGGGGWGGSWGRVTYSLSLGSSCVSPGCANTERRQQQHYELEGDQQYKHTQ